MRIEKGGLEARLILAPVRTETGGYVVPSIAEIDVYLKEKGVLTPLDVPSLEAGLARIAHGLNAEPIASRGMPPVQGGDGYLEYLIDFDGAFSPTTAESGAVDLRASLIRNVTPGQPLAVIHPPKPGQPGIDVFRRLVAAEPGKALEPRLGRNTERSAHDPNLIVAGAVGHARLVDGLLEVQEFYLVDGDVDYASGNVSFGKSVQVRGDVKAGFSLDAGGDVEVTGLIEDCTVKAQGKVLVKGGFTGQGKGMLHAKGDITLGYVRNQQVRGENEIRILKEAVNSRLQARRSVFVNGLLAGGKVQARYAIECQVAGTETGTPTQMEAGYDFTVAEEMIEIRAEMEKMGKYAKRLEDSLRQIQDVEKLNRGLEPWAIELMFELEKMRAKVDAKIGRQRERFSLLDRQASEPESATITVHKKAFPGVMVKIGREVMLVDEVLSGPKTFYSKDGAIQVR
ncbi:MAG TPA: FapA family protein [Fibrobacteria bacterium]|nr:FapA family protein [Fibrobacteria bacterium]